MNDLISRQAALEKVRAMQTYKLFVGDDMILVDKAEVQTGLMMLPSAQPEPQEGHWIWVAGELMCSECRTIYSDLYPDYDNSVACPHCGAKMTISTK